MKNKEINYKNVKNFLSLYIHLPFCFKKCFYCSFVVFVGQKDMMNEYVKCIGSEMSAYQRNKVNTIYLGGGTPTCLDLAELEKIFSYIEKYFSFDEDIEITIEANPESLDAAKLKLLRNLGVNRLSIGLQSLNDKYLKFLGRTHDKRIALRAYDMARKVGFKNINLDLMYGFPEQGDDELREDVLEVIDLDAEHLSLYSLNIEENSLFFAKKMNLPEKEKQAEQYLMVLDKINESDFLQYEISNFAKLRRESTHNINYWSGGNYIGVGVGAHSHQDGRRAWNSPRLIGYMKRINNNETPVEGSEILSKDRRLIESLLFGLRMNIGVCLEELETKFECRVQEEKLRRISEFQEQGLLEKKGERITTTRAGMLVLDEISAYLI